VSVSVTIATCLSPLHRTEYNGIEWNRFLFWRKSQIFPTIRVSLLARPRRWGDPIGILSESLVTKNYGP